MNWHLLWRRIIRAAKLETSLYEEIEKDPGSLSQAMIVVVLSAVAAGIGSISKIGIQGIFIGALTGLIGWYVWAMLIYLIGTRLLPESQTHSNLGELLRTIGFSSSPGLIRIFGIVDVFQRLIFSLAAAWMLVAMVIAVKCALDYKSTWRAVGVCLIGWVIQIVLLLILFSFFGGLKPI